MRWSVIGGGVALTVAIFAVGASAQYGYPAPTPNGYYPSPYSAAQPGCPAPVMSYQPAAPSGVIPFRAPATGNAPGTAMPSAGTPSTPSTAGTPGAGSSNAGSPGATAPSANAPGGAGANQGPSPGDQSSNTGAAESRGESGSDALASAAPNMYGDVFTGGGRSVFVQLPETNRLGGTFFNTKTGKPAVFTYTKAQVPTFSTPANTTSFGQPITTPFVASGPLTKVTSATSPNAVNGRVVTNNGVQTVIPSSTAANQQAPANGLVAYPLLENAQDKEATRQEAAKRYGAGGKLTYVSDPNISRAAPVGAQPGGLQGANISTFYDYTTLKTFTATVPTPASGGLVGRQKIAEDNSPLPRDRVFFNYDYFGGVNFGPKGQGVNRYSPGAEMTFFDMRGSVELRVPFASTINSNIVADGATADGVLLGNARVTFKGLLYRSEELYVSAGLAISPPTGADVGLRKENGTQLLTMVNESVILSPFVAALVQPTKDIYCMAYYAVDFDTMGTPVEVNLGGDKLVNVGRIYDAPFQMIDFQLGAWFYRCADEYAFVRGVTGFLEGHYNRRLGDGQNQTGPTYGITSGGDNFHELNITAGITTLFGTNSTFTVGAAFPVLGGDNKTFDFQIGCRANIFFGPTARSRERALAVSSF